MSDEGLALHELEAAVQKAFRTADDSGLDVLGYGELSSTLRWRAGDRDWACKRLPTFADQHSLERYSECFEAYIQKLTATGICVAPSKLHRLDSQPVLYCVQPAFDPELLLPGVLGRCGPHEVVTHFARVQRHIEQAVSAQLGLDGQASNWIVEQGQDRLIYLDVTTPLLRDAEGHDLLDPELFLVAAPAPTRPLLRRFLLQDIIDKYHSRRGVLMDFLANLYKERLPQLVPDLLDHQAGWVSPPLDQAEVESYYRSDAKTWTLWQRLRRADRWWQLKVRRRPYPFLLPGRRIER